MLLSYAVCKKHVKSNLFQVVIHCINKSYQLLLKQTHLETCSYEKIELIWSSLKIQK